MAGLVHHAPERVVQLWVRKGGAGRLAAVRDAAGAAGIAVLEADDRALQRLAGDDHHQGVVAEFLPSAPRGDNELDEILERAGSEALVLVLDRVQDPHNLGACLRTAAAAGVHAVVAPRDHAAGLTPAVRRAAAGAAEIVPLAMVANLARALDRLASAGLWRVGLAAQAEQALHEVDLSGPLALVAGGEEKGLRRLTRERCDAIAQILMTEAMESLNVSVAAGIALYEARRQRKETG